jgi:hypothetical protein
MRPNTMPSENLQVLLEGAKKFALHYQRETFAVTQIGYQQVKGWWKGPLETDKEFQAQFQKATQAFAWAITLQLKHGVGYPKGSYSHSDFAHVPGSGKLVASGIYELVEQRDKLISEHEDKGELGLVTLFFVEIKEGVGAMHFTCIRAISLDNLMGPAAYDTELALVRCQALV